MLAPVHREENREVLPALSWEDGEVAVNLEVARELSGESGGQRCSQTGLKCTSQGGYMLAKCLLHLGTAYVCGVVLPSMCRNQTGMQCFLGSVNCAAPEHSVACVMQGAPIAWPGMMLWGPTGPVDAALAALVVSPVQA